MNEVTAINMDYDRPNAGDLYLHVPSRDIYIVAALPEGAVALVSLSTGASWSSYKLFDECQENFRRLPPGTPIRLTVQENKL